MTTNKLASKRIVITRPLERSKVLSELIEENGGEVVVVPTLELHLVESPELVQMVDEIDTYDWIIFTSPAGVKSFFNLYKSNTISCDIAVIGVKTEEELKKYGNTPIIIPDKFTAEGLLDSFKNVDLKGKKIALPRTLSARTVLPEGLKEYGAEVVIAEAYTSEIPIDTKNIIDLADNIIDNKIDVITFTSPLTVKNLFEVVKTQKNDCYDTLIRSLRENIVICSIGPITSNMLKQYGLEAIEPSRYTVKDMVETLIEQI